MDIIYLPRYLLFSFVQSSDYPQKIFEGFTSLWISLSIQFCIQCKDNIRWYVINRWFPFGYVIWQTCQSRFFKVILYPVCLVSGRLHVCIPHSSNSFPLRRCLLKYQTMFGYFPILTYQICLTVVSTINVFTTISYIKDVSVHELEGT